MKSHVLPFGGNRSYTTHATRGSVLIVVMWACLGLVAMTLVFAHAMAMNYRGAGNDLAGRQADAAIEGAVRYAKSLLANPTAPGLFIDPTTYRSEAVPVGDATFWFLGGADAQDALNSRPYGLVDEASKLNVNTASADMLALLPGMTTDFASAIVAWRTPAGDDSALASGSVSGLGDNAYTPKGAAFETPDEVGMVNGADRTFLYGEDANLNHALDPNEDDGDKTLPADNSDGKLDPGLLGCLTTFTREPNLQPDGSPRINISDVANAVGALRALLAKTPALSSKTQAVLGHFAPPNNRVGSVLDFYGRSGLTADEFAPLAGALTTRTGSYITGLVNVNTASKEVLAAIPGIGADLAAALVGARLSRTTPDTNFAWAGDILKANPHALVEGGNYLTGSSYQTSVDVAAVGRNGRGYRRARFVIDTSTGTPRIIYRRDLSGLGWALGSDARQSLANAAAAR